VKAATVGIHTLADYSVWRKDRQQWSGLDRLSPLTWVSPPHVDAWQPRLMPNRLKPWPAGQEVGTVGWLLGPLGLGSGPLGPRVK
jgi:hypothetical protein